MRTKTLIIAVLCLALASTLFAQDPANPTPPAVGPVVSISLIVTDKDGKGITTLRKEQVRVFEDKDEQTILSLEADERPVDCVLLVDSSGSLRRLYPSVIEAAKLLIANRRPVDQIAVVRFVSTNIIEKTQEFTSDDSLLKKALDNLYLEKGQSAVIDALYIGADYVAEHNKGNEERRKVAVIVTDGEDRISYYKQQDLIKLLHQHGVQVFVLGLVVDLSDDKGFNKPGVKEKAEKLLKSVAEESGGRVFFPVKKEELVASAAEIILDLRAQFRIKYQSTHDASKKGFRKLDVKFVSPDGEKRNMIFPRAYHVGPRTPPGKKSEKK